MNSIFKLCVSAGGDIKVVDLAASLPAAPYALQDIWDRLHVPHGEPVRVEFSGIPDFPALLPLLTSETAPKMFDLCELNVLAQKLSELDEMRSITFDGLLKIQGRNRDKPLNIRRLIDIAGSTQCCLMLPLIQTDEELGEYVVENDLAPEMESIPDPVYDLLHYKCYFNYEKIGEQYRLEDGGVFVPRMAGRFGGYVMQHAPLIEAHQDMEFGCPQPDYTILLRLKSGEELKLPCQSPLPETEFECIDCKVPGLVDAVNRATGVRAVQQLAAALDVLGDRELPVLKAIVAAADSLNVKQAIWAAENIRHFIISPKILSPADIAEEEIKYMVELGTGNVLRECLNLYRFGEKLLEQTNDHLTEYGLIGREDGVPLLTPEFNPDIEPGINPGMEVMQ